MFLVVVRHGESLWNNANLFCGWSDVPLTAKGEAEARRAAQLIAHTGLRAVAVYTSTLRRSMDTAAIIVSALDLQPTVLTASWKLNERHYGALQGLDKARVLRMVGEQRYAHWRRSYTGVPPLSGSTEMPSPTDPTILSYATVDEARYALLLGPHESLPRGESLQMALDSRVRPYFQEVILPRLLATTLDECVLVVAHGSTLRGLLKHLYTISDASILEVNIPNGSPMVISVGADGLAVGDYTYLDPEGARRGAEKVRNQGRETGVCD